MIYKFSVHVKTGDDAPTHIQHLLPDAKSWKSYYVEATEELTDGQVTAMSDALCEPLTTRVAANETQVTGRQVQVAYKRGIVDNENDSIVELAHMYGIPAVAAKVAITYESESSVLVATIDDQVCNHTIEELHIAEPQFDSLLPQGSYETVETFDLRELDDEQLQQIGTAGGRVLDLHKMQTVRDIQRAAGLTEVTDVMLEALDARWSDHCAHTTWKSLGNLLRVMVESSRQANNPNVISMFDDNAGIWDFYDGYGIAIKPETHNGPSGVAAYFGQLTKIGGVLRDILGTGLGADPIGVFEYSATGNPNSPSPIAGRPTSRQIAHETIRAVKEYGNTFGVPMMWSHMTFHPAYRAKPFALGGSIGLIPLDAAEKGQAQSGDHAMLIGGLTGNDGIHGASGSSAGSVMDTTSVQIGSPLEEIKFREAILELRDANCLRAVTDLGAAGINSAFGEMGEDVGVWINTALVPLKTGGLAMWRILLSESQERMALAIPPDKLDTAREILNRHEVRNTVIGRFTGNNRYCVVYDEGLTEKHVVELDVTALPQPQETGFDLAYDLLKYIPPSQGVGSVPSSVPIEAELPELTLGQLAIVAEELMADCEMHDQSLASSQYDSSVGGRTYYGPFIAATNVPTKYFACKPLYGNDAAAVFNVEFNPWLYEAHPVLAARQSLLSVLFTQLLAGVALNDICLCDNFYTPHLSEKSNEWLVGMVHELAELAKRFGTPFISGKDSSAGSTNTDEGIISVPPAVFLSALGKVPHVGKLRTEQWQHAGNLLVRVGLLTPSLAGTVAARIFELDADDVDEVDVAQARAAFDALEQLPIDVACSGRVIGTGGMLGAALQSSIASNIAVELNTPGGGLGELFHEHRLAALIEVPQQKLSEVPSELMPVVVGRLLPGSASVTINETELLTDSVINKWKGAFGEAIA